MDVLMGYVRGQGATLVMVTHDDELARRHADRVVRLKDGRIEGETGFEG